jgi:hypothetical protein
LGAVEVGGADICRPLGYGGGVGRGGVGVAAKGFDLVQCYDLS